MYFEFRETFLTRHTVFSYIVSASSFRELVTAFDVFKGNRDVDVGDTCDSTKNIEPINNPGADDEKDVDEAAHDETKNSLQHTKLHKKEKTCLEYSLALIRLCSQK